MKFSLRREWFCRSVLTNGKRFKIRNFNNVVKQKEKNNVKPGVAKQPQSVTAAKKNKQTNKKKTRKRKRKKKREKEKTVFNLTTIFGHHSKAIHGDVLNV